MGVKRGFKQGGRKYSCPLSVKRASTVFEARQIVTSDKKTILNRVFKTDFTRV